MNAKRDIQAKNATQSTSGVSGWQMLGLLLIAGSWVIMNFSGKHSTINNEAFVVFGIGLVLYTFKSYLFIPSVLILSAVCLDFFPSLKHIPSKILMVFVIITAVYFWWKDRKAKGKGQPDA